MSPCLLKREHSDSLKTLLESNGPLMRSRVRLTPVGDAIMES